MKLAPRSFLALTAAAALALSACGGGSGGTSATGTGTDTGTSTGTSTGGGTDASGDLLSVANVVNGFLGDQGFFDDAESGIQALADAGHKTTTLQADANNPAQWKANIESVSGGDWDIVVAGTSQMVDLVTETAAKYPDQKYLIYDSPAEGANVASVVFKQNEGSFLAGVLAALVTTDSTNFPMANSDKVIGMLGGMDLPVINDFFAGFEAGAKAVDPDISVLVSYVGNFTDSQKGYDQTVAMYDQGADVVFAVAGGAGIGVLQAAADKDKYAIGVDQNQNALQPGFILASMLKHVGNGIQQAIEAAQDGSLEYGTTTAYGLANDGVGLEFADNNDIVPQSVIDKIDEYKQQVVDGKIEVPSVTG